MGKIDHLAKNTVNEFVRNGNHNVSNVYNKKLIYISKPTHGSFIYWNIRNFISLFKKKTKRCARYLDLNHDFSRAALVGVPKTNFDPKNNIFYIQMDNEEWAGIGSKMMLNISMNILFYLHISFWMYFIYYRMLVNNKFSVFSKWQNKE
ncbi:hypothetical protein PGSY75_0019700 [Plasmodium gaboni]|uniref:Uncharacterized protein n=1 Tax=Plasmodium gaboni TaxID=647221 RepID=A0A151L3C2_9APIC|nr:hypothetical protein PGSY75_0019700 [Plasmodium gaboni]KYN93337.1 hypothetical protein PGSY75_0019700 [Plasmodium gaboni]